jgi:hypothetical protein
MSLIKNSIHYPGMVVHTCNPNYSGGRGMRITSSRPDGQKVPEILSQKQEQPVD